MELGVVIVVKSAVALSSPFISHLFIFSQSLPPLVLIRACDGFERNALLDRDKLEGARLEHYTAMLFLKL